MRTTLSGYGLAKLRTPGANVALQAATLAKSDDSSRTDEPRLLLRMGNLAVAFAKRSFPGQAVCGDAWQIDWYRGVRRISVVDGLGHGPDAAEASRLATSCLAENPGLGPIETIHECHHALIGTRGAAISVVCLNLTTNRLQFAGLGNVDLHLWLDRHVRLAPDHGIVGSHPRPLHLVDIDLPPDWLLIIHSDGINSQFEVGIPVERSLAHIQYLADGLLQKWARPADDAIVVVASEEWQCPTL